MTFPRYTSLCLGLVAAVGFGLKARAILGSPAEHGADGSQIETLLSERGYTVGPRREDIDLTSIEARSGDCSMRVYKVSPRGFHTDLVRQLATPTDRLFFAYSGTIYDRQPVWTTWTYAHWHRLSGFLGRTLPNRPVIAVLQSPACDASVLPWSEITEADS